MTTSSGVIGDLVGPDRREGTVCGEGEEQVSCERRIEHACIDQVDRTALREFFEQSTHGAVHTSGKCDTVSGDKPEVLEVACHKREPVRLVDVEEFVAQRFLLLGRRGAEQYWPEPVKLVAMHNRPNRLALVGVCSIVAAVATAGCGDSAVALCRAQGNGATAAAAVEAFYAGCDTRVNEIKGPLMVDEWTASFVVARSGTSLFVTARQQSDGSWLVIEEGTGP
jgi:hypothetical protein